MGLVRMASAIYTAFRRISRMQCVGVNLLMLRVEGFAIQLRSFDHHHCKGSYSGYHDHGPYHE